MLYERYCSRCDNFFVSHINYDAKFAFPSDEHTEEIFDHEKRDGERWIK
jgi:hypothetical protein